MGTSFEQFANEIRAFNARKDVVNALRRDLRKPVPELRRDVRASATSTLPAAGGLGAWVARARVTVKLKERGRSAGIRIKVSRAAGDGDKADLDKLDRYGETRHPLHGNRNHWYPQKVAAGFFTKPWDAFRPKFIKVADESVDKALDVIRRG